MANIPANAAPKAPSREDLLASTIMQRVGELAGFAGKTKEASDALGKAEDAEKGGRRKILIDLAALSAKEKYTPEEITKGVAAAVALYEKSNKQLAEKTFENFIGAAKAAMHAEVRDKYPALVKMAKAAWAKTDEKSQAIKAAYNNREDFLIHAMASAAAAKPSKSTQPVPLPTSVDDIQARADEKLLNRRRDPNKARGKIKGLRKVLEDTFAEFPLDTFQKMAALCDKLCQKNVLENALLQAEKARAKAAPAPSEDDDGDDDAPMQGASPLVIELSKMGI